jgi:formylglycine-generating enzyme required for sulfatase activity
MKPQTLFLLLAALILAGCGKEVSVAPTPTEEPITVPELNLEMMPIPSGTFVMGSPSDEEGRDDVESPQTTVTITKPFWLGKTEVTQSQWKAVMGNSLSNFKGDDLPVENVSWNDAVAFCAKLNQEYGITLPSGYRYTLPTEAQWEYACRAGTTIRFYYGDDPSYRQLGKYAWYDDNSSYKTHPVGEKVPNGWGLYDMHGNVCEWCLDGYSDSYPGGNVTAEEALQSGSARVLRGGSWFDSAGSCRSAVRGRFRPDSSYDYLGFRVALSPVPSEYMGRSEGGDYEAGGEAAARNRPKTPTERRGRGIVQMPDQPSKQNPISSEQ